MAGHGFLRTYHTSYTYRPKTFLSLSHLLGIFLENTRFLALKMAKYGLGTDLESKCSLCATC